MTKKDNYGLSTSSKKKYREAIEKMDYSQLFEEYEARAMRSSGGFLDPLSKDMLKIVRKELIGRLKAKDVNFKAARHPQARSGKNLFDLLPNKEEKTD